ncbi:MAG: adenylate/guanylate cyclase domain-containing protein [Betaproteobacteria bacterium]
MAGKERNLAVLFADVSGSTKLYERLGDAEALRAVDRVIKRMERAIQGFKGRLVKTIGDEVMATFNTAEDAFMASTEMQQRVSDLPAVSGVKLTIRVGFHYGSAIEEANDVFGDTVNTAARIVGLANSEQILSSKQTIDELPALLRDSTRDLEQLSVKGKADGVHVFEVLWRQTDELTMKAKSIVKAPGAASVKLCLRYRGKAFLLDDKSALLTMGRDHGSDLVIEDRKASRHHARIERRGDKYMIIDQSTNGTYLAPKGEKEVLLRREEVLLQGAGTICFGGSINETHADFVQYEHL